MNSPSVSRRFKLLALATCAFVWLLLAANALGMSPAGPSQVGASSAAAPVEPPRTIPNTDLNPYGANFFFEWEPETWKIEKTMQMAREAGLGWIKQQFPWENIQLSPGENGYWDDRLNKSTWEKYDRIVELAQKYDLEIIARLDRPPTWSRKDNRFPEAPPDRFEDYGEFVHTLASRYRGKIRYYQIWNEPNVFPEWGDKPPDPAAYTRLLKIAAERIRQADPDAWILSAPLAQTLEVSDRNLSDLVYLEKMYEAGAKSSFDILFANAYGFAFPPDDPPSPDRLNFSRVVLLRQIMEKHGDADKPVWFNEFGWNAAPEDFPAERLPWARVSEQTQAAYTVQAIEQARAEWPWAGVFNIWYFRQAGNQSPDRPEYYFRMVDPGFTPRPLYHAVKKAATSRGAAGPGAHEETDPAATFTGEWLAQRRPDASGGAARVSQRPGDSVTIAFRGTGIALRAETAPSAGTLYVTLDGREANRLPRDRQGRSYLDLSSAADAYEWFPIADGLPDAEHTLRMVVTAGQKPESQSGTVVVDGFEVASVDDASPLLSGLTRLAPFGLGTIALAALAWRLVRRR